MSYDIFSRFYDTLTDNVEYRKRADYFCRLLSSYGVNGGILLDLACGTGSMSVEMASRGYDVIGVDCSVGMLNTAQAKAFESGKSILFLCQDMRELDLYGTVDCAVSVLDSINHLPDITAVKQAFNKVSLFMNRGGIFAFDMNTLHKHREILGDNAFIYDCGDFFCAWQNELREDDCTVDITLDFFEQDDDGSWYRSGEEFAERAYEINAVKELLNECGFEVMAVLDDMSETEATENSERAVFVAKKI